MSYSWYRVDGAFVQHPKTLRLRKALNNPTGDAYINRLWSWVQRYAPSGRFDVDLADELERAMEWTGEPGGLVAALEKTGWLERRETQFEAHDWADFQEFYAKKAKRDADIKRLRHSRRVAKTSKERRGTVENASHERHHLRTDGRTDVTDGRTDDLFAGSRPQGKSPKAINGDPQQSSAKQPDPRLHPLREKLCEVYRQLEGSDYPFDFGRELKVLQKLLARKPHELPDDLWPANLSAAWRKALISTHPDCKTLERFLDQLPRHLGTRNGVNGEAERQAAHAREAGTEPF